VTRPTADKLVDELDRRGLAAPALVLLAAHRPLRPLLRQAGIFLGPLATALLGDRSATLRAAQAALDDDAAYAAIERRLTHPDRLDGEG